MMTIVMGIAIGLLLSWNQQHGNNPICYTIALVIVLIAIIFDTWLFRRTLQQRWDNRNKQQVNQEIDHEQRNQEIARREKIIHEQEYHRSKLR